MIASINNLFKDVSIYNGSGRGINLDWSSSSIISPYNTVISLIAANMTGTGISVEVESNFLFNLTSSNNSGGEGVNIANSANSNLISNLLTVNNSGPGILTGTSNDNTFQNTINYSSGNPQIQLGGANNRFTGVLKVKTATSSCTVVGGAGLDTNCAGGITSDFNSGSNLPETIASLGSTVQGKVTTTDGEFLSGSLAFSSITNWTSFSNPFRTIGKDGTDLDDMNIQNRCSSGTCRLWDWSLKLGDTIARNTNICPLGSHFITHKFNVAGASAAVCNSTLIGSTYDSGTLCKLTFLRNAVELIGDGVGNDNGICESNEDCLYTPNVGTYQGHGAIVPASQVTSTTNTCADITTGGTIQNVKLYKYEANGY